MREAAPVKKEAEAEADQKSAKVGCVKAAVVGDVGKAQEGGRGGSRPKYGSGWGLENSGEQWAVQIASQNDRRLFASTYVVCL